MDAERTMERLVRRAFVLRALARSVGTPGPDDAAEIRRAVTILQDGLREAGPLDRSDGSGADTWPSVPAHLTEAVASTWQHWELSAARREHTRLFCGRVPVPPNETSYGDGRRPAGKPRELADISGFYTAFGFAPALRSSELFDHIAVELEFLSLMLLKRAFALELDDGDAGAVSFAGTMRFLEDHLGRWVPAFVAQCLAHEPSPSLASAVLLMEKLVAEECRMHGAAPVLQSGSVAQEADDAAFSCPHESAALH